jgi:deoxyribodipyrimidine photo-lyase
MGTRAIVWFRYDLRLRDNSALTSAVRDYEEIIPVFIWSPSEDEPWQAGGASKWWLHHSLGSLQASLKEKDNKLILRAGDAQTELKSLLEQTKAEAVFWNRSYEPQTISRDKKIKTELKGAGLLVESFPGAMLMEPWDIKTGSGDNYKVFTPFWKKLQEQYEHVKPDPIPQIIPKASCAIDTLDLEDLSLLPEINWDRKFYEIWTPGEKESMKLLRSFLRSQAEDYKELRDFPSVEATSGLSAPLHFGELSPRLVWHEAQKCIDNGNCTREGVFPFLRQLAWRDFSRQLLYYFPSTDLKPLRSEFEKFPWKENKEALALWQKGKTGYPIVDAGMRELWATGTMHNRVRMIVASFLVKHLLIPWQEGAKWFWDTLVDADLANNTMGWQWTAGCGADAAPYFRVFNPILQGEKFDGDGEYVKRWLPELEGLPSKWIHRPWEATSEILKNSNVELGQSYPEPIIDHGEGRDRALEAYEDFKEGSS